MKKLTAIFLLVVLLTFGISSLVLADGTETLGPPSIPISSGTGIVAAGTGLAASQPGTIDVNVPGNVVQVLVYWGGATVGIGVGDNTISLNGTPVTGMLIGGPAFFFTCPAACGANQGDFFYSNYRADITGLGLVGSGVNSLTVGGMNFGGEESGAGLLVIFDDGSDTTDIQVVDGLDLAFAGFPEPRQTTVPQTFTFTAASIERTADLVIFAGSVGADGRSNTIKTITNGPNGATTDIFNLLSSADGDLWDTLTIQVPIPAEATELTVEAISGGPDNNPASLNWVGAGLSVPPPPPPGGEGCTPGYWKNHLDDWLPTGYFPGDDFDATFGVDNFDPDITLEEAVNAKGGGVKKLARHGTAALLSAAHSDVNYPYTVAEVIAFVQAGDADSLADANELGCPIN